MKKSTKKLTLVLVSVLIFVLCIGVMVACDNLSDHDFSGEWKMDGTKHWKECECGTKGLETAHIDIDENGTCDICGYDKMHVHSYGEWKSDGVNHWKECSCGEQIEKSAHTQGDGEKCSICGYDMHEHSYGEWKSNETNHWKECSCGLKSEEGAHADSNNDEKCDACGYDMHKHSYIIAKNADGHWNYCTACQHAGEVEPHVDAKDADGNAGQDEICDICGYNMHVHDYAAAWSKDATNHWHECTCGDKSDEAAHVDAKDADGNDGHDGKCDACGWDGSFTVTVKDSKGNGIKDVELEINEVVAKTDENGIATFNMFVPDHELIYFNDYPSNYYKNASYYTELGTSSYEITLISEITNTFEIIDQKTSSPIANVTLKLMDGETVAASGETDSEGKVTLTYAVGEGKYYYAIEGLTAAQYLSNAGISKNHVPDEDSKVTTITVYSYVTYTITVKCDEGVEHTLEGLTVKVDKYTGTTNASGVAEIDAPAASSLYTVSVSGLEDGFEAEDGEVGYDWWEMTTTYETTLTIKAKSEGGGEGGEGGSGSTIASIPEDFIGDWVDEQNIVYSVYTTSIWIEYEYYSLDDITIVSNTEIIVDGMTWTIAKGNRIVITAEDMDPIYLAVKYPTLDEGNNTVDASYYGEGYEFTADVAGTYIISTESDIAYISISTGDEIEGAGSVSIALEKDQNILIFFMIQEEGEDAKYDVNISQVYPSIEEGTTTITTEGIAGVKYTFTADKDGTYTISSEYVDCFIYCEVGSDYVSFYEGGSVSVVLNAGDKITISCSTWKGTDACSYDVTISYSETVEGGGEGDQGGDEDPSITFPEGLIGTWYLEDDTEIVISSKYIAMNDNDCIVETPVEDENTGIKYYYFTCLDKRYAIYYNEDAWYINSYVMGHVDSTEKLLAEGGEGDEPAITEIPEAFIGTWTGYDSWSEENVTYIITADGVNDGANNNTIANGDVTVKSETEIKIWDNSLKYDAESKTISVYEGSDLLYTLTKSTEGGDSGTDTPVESDIFPESLRGTWYTSLGKVLEIGANSITFDGTEGINLAATDNDGTTVYTFNVGKASYSLYQRDDVLYLDDNWNPAEEISQTKPVFLDAIPEAFYGTWTGVLEGEHGDMEYEYSISADGISDGYYTSTIENGDIIVMSETKIYMVEGGAYLILNDGKISLDTDGTGEYVVVLSKKATSNLVSKIEGATMSSFAELAEAAPDSGDSSEKYYTIGYVKSIYNTTFGNMYIQDDEGNEFCIYGVYGFDGKVRFDSLPKQPKVGDVVVMYGKLNKYNSVAQMKNAWLMQIGTEVQTETDAYKMAQIKVSSPVEKDFELSELATWTVKSGTGITLDGNKATVTRGEEDQTVVLTATIGEVSKDFTVVVTKAPSEDAIVIDFKTNYSTYATSANGWTSSYAAHTLTASDLGITTDMALTVAFTNANAQQEGNTIDNMPVVASKSSATRYVTVSVSDLSITSVSFGLKEWTTSKKFTTVTIQYTTDGTTWVDTNVGLVNGTASSISTIGTTISANSLPEGVSAVRLAILGATTSNHQVGIETCTIVAE